MEILQFWGASRLKNGYICSGPGWNAGPCWELFQFRLAQEGTTHSFPTQAKNFLHGLVINIKHTLKESPIHCLKIELKTKGAILMGDIDERKEDDGRGVF